MSEKRRSRGAHPEDKALFTGSNIPLLKKACTDLSRLLSDGYPLKASLKLVGDRFKLRERQRKVLMRSAAAGTQAKHRFSKRRNSEVLRGRKVFIDGFNYLITAEAMCSGAPVFRGQDGFLRDLSGTHGTYRRVVQTEEVLDFTLDFFRSTGVSEVIWILDRRVSNSGRLKALITEKFSSEAYPFSVSLSEYADRELKDYGRSPETVIISSDSIITDAVENSFPLTDYLLAKGTWLIDFRDMSKPVLNPPFLNPGDCVAVLAPAGFFPPEKIALPVQKIKEAGFEVEEMPTLTSFHDPFYRFAGSDETRLKDLQEALDNPEIKAIICARGGYGTSRILNRLNFDTFRKQPKWLVGFSDLTALHARLYREGFASLHGLMPSFFDREGVEPALKATFDFLKGNYTKIKAAPCSDNREGKAEGVLLGGNLSVFAHLLGSRDFPDTAGSILFLEEVGEALYAVDRLLEQLERSGAFDKIAGLIVGELSEKEDKIREMLSRRFANREFPMCFNFPLGHHVQNLPIPHGMRGGLSVDSEGVTLEFNNK